MQYYNQNSYPHYSGYQSQYESSYLGKQQASYSHPWYWPNATPSQSTAVQQEMIQEHPSQYQVYTSSLPTSYPGFANEIQQLPGPQDHLIIAGPNPGSLSQNSCTLQTQRENYSTSPMTSAENGYMMMEGQKCTTASRSFSSSNPLSLNFAELRQAMGEDAKEVDGGPASEDRKKYGDRKPPYSYVAMIHMALKDNLNKKCTLREILDYIEDRFPYYKQHSRKLHGAIRHNLTLNDCFVKAGRRLGDKGCLWTLDKDYEGMFEQGSLLRRKCRLLEGRVDKYNRNSRKKSKGKGKSGAKSPALCDGRRAMTLSVDDSTSPSGFSACSVSPSEGGSSRSSPMGSDTSPAVLSDLQRDLEEFSDLCHFPEFNNNKNNNSTESDDVTNVCRRLSTELADEVILESPTNCGLEQSTTNSYSACAYVGNKNHIIHHTPAKTLDNDVFSSVPGLDVEFPAFLEIPDIMGEVDMGLIQSGFNASYLS